MIKAERPHEAALEELQGDQLVEVAAVDPDGPHTFSAKSVQRSAGPP